MRQLLAPGVEHREAPNLRAEMLGVPGDILERLGDRAKEEAIEGRGFWQHQGAQRVRQSKDHMDGWCREHLALPGREPGGLGGPLTFRAAPVAAGVVRLHFVRTVIALGDMAPKGRRATERDGPQGPLLHAREGCPIALKEDGPMLADDIGDFQGRATHGSLPSSAGKTRASRGLSVAVERGVGHVQVEAGAAQTRMPEQ